MINNTRESKDQVEYSVIRKSQASTNRMKQMNKLESLIPSCLSKKRCSLLQWGEVNRNKNYTMRKGFNIIIKPSALVVFYGVGIVTVGR